MLELAHTHAHLISIHSQWCLEACFREGSSPGSIGWHGVNDVQRYPLLEVESLVYSVLPPPFLGDVVPNFTQCIIWSTVNVLENGSTSRNHFLLGGFCANKVVHVVVLPTPLSLASGGSPIFPLVVHLPAVP